MRDPIRLGMFGLMCLAAGWLLAAGERADAQGKYAEVTDADVVALKLNHYFGADKKGRDRDFEWTFTKTEFVVKKGKGAIPADLMERLLPAGAAADEIRGKWKLEGKDGKKLVLTEIKAGDTAGKKDVSLVIYRTAPTVVRIGNPQYVFGVD
jgi:hypothetical protein